MDWYWEISFSCSVEQSEIISFVLFELGATGIEELSDQLRAGNFRVYFDGTLADPEKLILSHFDEMALGSLQIITVEKKPVQNWQENWKEHFKPLRIGKNLLVRSPWHEYEGNRKEIIIDPGFGFGTGYHDSTRLALQLMDSMNELISGRKVIDVGTGSGILSIAALLFGAEEVLALDIDIKSLQEVAKNVELSGLKHSRITILQATPDAIAIQTDLLLVNVTWDIIRKYSARLKKMLRSNGLLILSGILLEQQAEVESEFSKFEIVKELKSNEWYAVTLKTI